MSSMFSISYKNLIKSSTLLLINQESPTRKQINDYRRNLEIYIKLLNNRESFELLKKHYSETENTVLVKYRIPFEECLVMLFNKNDELNMYVCKEYIDYIIEEPQLVFYTAKFNKLLSYTNTFQCSLYVLKYLLDIYSKRLDRKTSGLISKMFSFTMNLIDKEKNVINMKSYYNYLILYLSGPVYVNYYNPILEKIRSIDNKLKEQQERIIKKSVSKFIQTNETEMNGIDEINLDIPIQTDQNEFNLNPDPYDFNELNSF